MTIDYSNLTVEQLAAMSEEELNSIDPTQLPKSNGSSELTLDDLAPADSNGLTSQEPSNEEPVLDTPVEEVIPDNTNPEVNPHASEGTQGSAEQSEAPTAEIPVTKQEGEPNREANQPSTTEAEFYQKVTAKFNASGREFQIDKPEDVIALMQQGIDYNLKMSKLKPALKMVKSLEANGITADNLGLLLDIHQRKPEAIAKLVKDADIDLYGVDDEQVAQYAPTQSVMSDAEYSFNEVTDSLQDIPVFNDVIGFISASAESDQQFVYQNPQLLKTLTEQAQSGLFQQVLSRIAQERALGRLQGITNLQAYDMIGTQMFGGQPTPTAQPQVQTQPVAQPVVKPVVQSKPNPARQAAAAPSSNKQGAQTSVLTPEQIWNMSEEEILKLDPNLLT